MPGSQICYLQGAAPKAGLSTATQSPGISKLAGGTGSRKCAESERSEETVRTEESARTEESKGTEESGDRPGSGRLWQI